MDRSQKATQIAELKDIFENVESLVLSNVNRMKSDGLTTLRKNFRDNNVRFKVFKNKLAVKAMAGTGAQVLEKDFEGPVAIAWSLDDAVAPARVIAKSAKELENLVIKVGYSSGARLDLDQVNALAALPSLGELRSQLLGTMLAVPSRLLAQFQAPASHLVGVISAKVEKDEKAAA